MHFISKLFVFFMCLTNCLFIFCAAVVAIKTNYDKRKLKSYNCSKVIYIFCVTMFTIVQIISVLFSVCLFVLVTLVAIGNRSFPLAILAASTIFAIILLYRKFETANKICNH